MRFLNLHNPENYYENIGKLNRGKPLNSETLMGLSEMFTIFCITYKYV